MQDPESSKRHLPSTPRYEDLRAQGPDTRSSSNSKCGCQICLIARMTMAEHTSHAKQQSNPVGAPKICAISPPARCLPLCSKCYSIVSKSVSHICKKSTKQDNLADIVKWTSAKSITKVTSDVLRSICSQSGVTLRGGELKLSTGGKPMQVQIGKPQNPPKTPRFSLESLKRLQSAYNFSDKATK